MLLREILQRGGQTAGRSGRIMSDLKEVLTENSYLRQKQLIFADCDRYQRARVSTLLSIAAAVAGADYDARGLTYDKLYEMREVFLLSRVALRIHRDPRALQTVDVTTWEDGVKGAHMQRVYEIADSEGVMVSIRSDWILVDPVTRRIMRPGTFTAKKLGTCPKAIDAQVEQLASVLRAGDAALADHRHLHRLRQAMHQIEVRARDMRGVGSVPREGRCYDVRSSVGCGYALLEGRNIGHHQAAELLLDLLDHLDTRCVVGVGTIGHVQGNDVGSCLEDFPRTVHVQSNTRFVAFHILLVDTNNGKLDSLANGRNMLRIVGTDADSSAELRSLRHQRHILRTIQSVLLVCLAGHDNPSLDLFNNRCHLKEMWGS